MVPLRRSLICLLERHPEADPVVGIHHVVTIETSVASAPVGRALAVSAKVIRTGITKARRSRILEILVGALFALMGAGCMTPNFPPTAVDQPGWVVRETAAIWRPGAAAAELAGELLSARHDDGSQFVQFSKQGLPLVIARCTTNAWEISSPLQPRRYSGRLGRNGPPDHVPWFLCATLPPAPRVGSRWRVVIKPDGTWSMLNPGSGESIEGVP